MVYPDDSTIHFKPERGSSDMDLFDKIGKFARDAADKTGDLIEVTRLNTKIGALKAEIAALMGRIGEHYWKRYEADGVCDPALAGVFAEIREHFRGVAELEAEIQTVKNAALAQAASASGKTVCPSCGTELPAGTRFCGSCGAKI